MGQTLMMLTAIAVLTGCGPKAPGSGTAGDSAEVADRKVAPTKLSTYIKRLSSEKPNVRRDAERQIRFLGGSMIRPLVNEGSLPAARMAYELGHFAALSPEQKRELSIAWVDEKAVPLASGTFASGTIAGLGEPIARHILSNREAYYEDLKKRLATSPRAAQMIALWGTDKDTALEIYRAARDAPPDPDVSKPPMANTHPITGALWAYRDLAIAREVFADNSVSWPVAERILLAATGACPYSMLTSKKESESKRRAAWKTWLDAHTDADAQASRKSALDDSMTGLAAFLFESDKTIKAVSEKGDAYQAYGDLKIATYDRIIRAAVISTLQNNASAARHYARAKTNLAKLESLGPKIGLWPAFEKRVAEILDESAARLKSRTPHLPPLREIPRASTRRISMDQRVEAVRQAIIADRPPLNAKAWRKRLAGMAARPIYADLPTTILRRLKQDENEIVRNFSATRILWRTKIKLAPPTTVAKPSKENP